MPVDSVHADYAFWRPWWTTIDDVVIGHPAIREKGQTYLPRPSGQDARDYKEYSDLATFFNATGRTLNAIIGMLFRKPSLPTNISPPVEARLLNIDRQGNTLASFLRILGREIYKKGRVGVMLDNPSNVAIGEAPYLTYFSAEQIIDWHQGRREDGSSFLLQVRIRDSITLPSLDEFVPEHRDRIRSYEIIEGRYQIREWIANDKGQFPEAGVVVALPHRQNVRLDFIPFHIFGSVPGIGATVCPSPLLDLAIENLAHYWATADYENARHIAGNPTPVVYDDGFKQEKGKLRLGARSVLKLSTAASASFLALNADLISALLDPMRERKENMAALGLQMIAPQRQAVEAEGTHILRQAGETASLVDVAMSLETGIEWLLQKMGWWAGETETVANRLVFHLSKDFLPTRIDSGHLRELRADVVAGNLSRDSYLWNLQTGEVLPPDRTIEEEKTLIELDDARLLRGEPEE